MSEKVQVTLEVEPPTLTCGRCGAVATMEVSPEHLIGAVYFRAPVGWRERREFEIGPQCVAGGGDNWHGRLVKTEILCGRCP